MAQPGQVSCERLAPESEDGLVVQNVGRSEESGYTCDSRDPVSGIRELAPRVAQNDTSLKAMVLSVVMAKTTPRNNRVVAFEHTP